MDSLCLYLKNNNDKNLKIITLYVDNPLLAGNDMNARQWMECELSTRFDIKDFRKANLCVGLEIIRDRANRKPFLSVYFE